MSKPDTVDFSRSLRELYHAGKRVTEVEAPRGVFLSYEATGIPGGDAFQAAVTQLYGVAYTLKHMLKADGVMDFKVGMLECLWFNEAPPADPVEWHWRLLLRIPEQVKPAQVRAARRDFEARKDVDAGTVRRTSWREGKALQVLHVGPYDAVAPTYADLTEQAAARHYRVRGPAHEIYLNDPRRVGPERTRTIVRLPVSHPRPAHAHGTS